MSKRDEVRNCLRAIMGFTVADSNRVCDRLAELLVPGDTVRYLYSCLKGWHHACDGGPVDQRCSCACHTKPAHQPEPEKDWLEPSGDFYGVLSEYYFDRAADGSNNVARVAEAIRANFRADRDALKAERDKLRELLRMTQNYRSGSWADGYTTKITGWQGVAIDEALKGWK